ncbi:MAG: hypothetical protein IJA60_01600 [Clostridia bacterium]|nr:hypothetical protein [Clostridia bacterium]
MGKNLTKEERIREKEKLSNAITNKMAIAFVALVVGIILLVRFGEYTVPSMAMLVCSQIVFGLLTAAALAWCVVDFKRGTDSRLKIVSSPFVLGVMASAFFAVMFYPTIGAFRVILALIAFALLFFVYEIYAADFFLCSVAMIVSCIAAMVVNNAGFAGYNILANCIAVVVALAVSAVCAVAIYIMNRDGKLKVWGKVIRKPQGGSHILVYVGIAVAFVAVIATLILGYLLYCMAAACAVYAVIAIIYTVKLM